VTIEPRSSPYQRRQINHLATTGVLAKDRHDCGHSAFAKTVAPMTAADALEERCQGSRLVGGRRTSFGRRLACRTRCSVVDRTAARKRKRRGCRVMVAVTTGAGVVLGLVYTEQCSSGTRGRPRLTAPSTGSRSKRP